MDKIQLKTGEGDEKPDEKVLDIPENIMDQIRLVSTYKESMCCWRCLTHRTKKIAAIASYVIEALEQGRILVVDERLDSSIHFKPN